MDAEFLTKREYDCASRIALGYSYKKVADELQIKFKTVSSHLSNVYQKLNVKNRFELAKIFNSDLAVHKVNPKQAVTAQERIKSVFGYLPEEERRKIASNELAKKAGCSLSFAQKFLRSKRGSRKLIRVVYKTRSVSLRELSEISGIKERTLYSRIFLYGFDVERALAQPVRRPRRLRNNHL